jgi:uncharacterized protein YaiI (UPF0178 family)
VLIVDAANVVGSRPTGWWRNRPGAARQLTARIRQAADRLPGPVVVVLEGQARDGEAPGTVDGVEVVHAPGSGDDTIVALADGGDEPALVVTADRGLAERVRRTGGDVVGPSWLLDRLDDKA